MTRHSLGGTIRVLITGFGRYPGVRQNPTAALMRRVVERLNRHQLGIMAHGAELTVSYAQALNELGSLTRHHTPDAILLMGLAARARWVRIERYARTLDSPLHADSTGRGGASHATGSHLPLSATGLIGPTLFAMKQRSVRVRPSASAGRYLCNAVYAAALANAAGRPVLFIHVPYPGSKSGEKPMSRRQSWQPTMFQLELALVEIACTLAKQARRARMGQSALA